MTAIIDQKDSGQKIVNRKSKIVNHSTDHCSLTTAHFFILLCMFILSCDSGIITSKDRSEDSAEKKDDVVIGVVDTSVNPTFFLEGIHLAVEDINQSGGIFGRKIRTVIRDDRGDIERGQSIAREFASNSDVIAVIGHRYSSVAIPVSITYEKSGIVFISPGATHPSLTRYGGEFVFRNIPTDEETGRQAAELAYRKGYKNIIIFYQRDSGGKRLAEIFHEHAVEKGIDILTTRSFFKWQTDFRSILSILKKEYKFDAIFIAGMLPASAYLIKQARDIGIKVPFLGGDGLDSPKLMTIAGRAAEGTIISTVFDPKYHSKRTRDFVRRFESKYGFTPDTWAAQSYDAVSVFAHAIETGDSAVPIVIASTMRFLENWEGVTGAYSFTRSGDITGKSIFFKTVQNGKFAFLEQYEKERIDIFDYMEEFTLRLPLEGTIPTIDPGLTMDMTSIEVVEQLFLGLTDFDPLTYSAVPELATHWAASQDGKTYVFHLRSDVTWTDGKPVTANDVVWAIRRNILPETKSPYAHMLYLLKNAKAIHNGEIKDVSQIGVRAVDNFIVVFELENPASYFPAIAGLWVFRPLPAHVIEKNSDYWTNPETIQTNGSYQLAAWEKGMIMILRKNPDYFDEERVAIPEVRYYVVPQSSLGLAMYENNELDIMGSGYLQIPLDSISRIKANPVLSLEYFRKPHFCTYAFAFNMNQPPVDNPLVRKAISSAIDRQLIIDALTGGDEEPANTYARPPVFGSVDPKQGIGIQFDPLRAKKLMEDAGFPNGKGFPSISLLYNTSETHSKIAHAVKACLHHYLNIQVELVEWEWDKYVSAITSGNPPHMFRAGWCADYPDANSFLNEVFYPSKPFYQVGWDSQNSDPDPLEILRNEFIKLMDMAQQERDPNIREEDFLRAEQILCEEAAVAVPIYFYNAHCLVKPRIKGWYHMAVGGQHIRNWRIEEQ